MDFTPIEANGAGDVYFLDAGTMRAIPFNQTLEWIDTHLAAAVMAGTISIATAFESAIDPRPLPQRLSEYDARRKAFSP